MIKGFLTNSKRVKVANLDRHGLFPGKPVEVELTREAGIVVVIVVLGDDSGSKDFLVLHHKLIAFLCP